MQGLKLIALAMVILMFAACEQGQSTSSNVASSAALDGSWFSFETEASGDHIYREFNFANNDLYISTFLANSDGATYYAYRGRGQTIVTWIDAAHASVSHSYCSSGLPCKAACGGSTDCEPWRTENFTLTSLGNNEYSLSINSKTYTLYSRLYYADPAGYGPFMGAVFDDEYTDGLQIPKITPIVPVLGSP